MSPSLRFQVQWGFGNTSIPYILCGVLTELFFEQHNEQWAKEYHFKNYPSLYSFWCKTCYHYILHLPDRRSSHHDFAFLLFLSKKHTNGLHRCNCCIWPQPLLMIWSLFILLISKCKSDLLLQKILNIIPPLPKNSPIIFVLESHNWAFSARKLFGWKNMPWAK